MESSNELTNLTCLVPEHSNLKIIGFCIDPNCKYKNKFACQECFFDVHSGHKLVKIDIINSNIQNKIKNGKIYLEEEKKIGDLFSKYENIQKNHLEQLKQKIILELDEKLKEYKNTFIKKMKGINNNKNNININMIKSYQEFFVGNAAPVQRPDYLKLSEICSSIYKDNDQVNAPNNNYENMMKSKLLLEELNKSSEEFLKSQYISLSKYINNEFLISKSSFEWCLKTYGGYDFFYELESNKTKATKKLSQGTMTVLRAKEPLYDNNIYRLKFKIGLRNMGDFDIGIGTDKTGESCWLRTKESICISNTGIIKLDINMDNSIKLKDKDIVDLEINTKIGEKTFRGYINNKLVCFIDFDLKDTIYIMAAMRNVGSFIELQSYNVIPIEI